MLYKNWKAICQIVDNHLMLVLAMLDLESDSGLDIANRFPEYFSKDQLTTVGPVPLSALKKYAEKEALSQFRIDDAAESNMAAHRNLVCLGATSAFDVPTLRFLTDAREDPLKYEIEFLPDALASASSSNVGDIFDWRGKPIQVIENTDDIFITFVPFGTVLFDR